MTISRRVFVKAGGLTLVSLGLDPLFLARAAFAARRPGGPPSRPILVCLFQRGAVDGLNLIVPHGEPAYSQERPRLWPAAPAYSCRQRPSARPRRSPGVRITSGAGSRSRSSDACLRRTLRRRGNGSAGVFIA